MPNESLTLLSSLASTLAWPITTLTLAFLFRRPLTKALGRIRSFSMGQVNAELDTIISRSIDVVSLAAEDRARSLEIQRPMIEVVAKLSIIEGSDQAIQHLASLAREYDSLRAALPKGERRTTSLELIASRMRLFAAPAREKLKDLTSSESAGERLAAIVTLQAFPDAKYLDWLFKRFSEERAFTGYHAALAIRSAVRCLPNQESLLEAIRDQLRHLDSKPSDRRTMLRAAEREAGGSKEDDPRLSQDTRSEAPSEIKRCA